MRVAVSKIQAGLRAFRGNRRGGVAVMFALSFTPVAFLSLVMIDFSRASTARANMQQTLDASALIVARSTSVTPAAIQSTGAQAFSSQIATNLGMTVSTDTFTIDSTNTVIADATGSVQPLVSGLFLGGPIQIAAHSEVSRSMTKLEIAMVLDTTGSMQGSKISNLQTAADSFIDIMSTAAAGSSLTNPVKISIVPFAMTVKVSSPISMTNYNTGTYSVSGLPTWLDGRAQSTPWNLDVFTIANASAARVDRFAILKTMKQSWNGCVENRAAPYDVTDDPPTATPLTASPTTAQMQSMFTPWFWPDEPDNSYYTKVNFGTSQNDYIADGYAKNSKSSVLPTFATPQGNVAKYTGATPKSGTNKAGYDYGPNSGCAMQQLARLTTNFSSLKTTVGGLVASGETNIPVGLAWGWHTLSPNAPFSDGSAYGTANLTKVLVLMTDGENTMSNPGDDDASDYHGYGYNWQGKLGTPTTNTTTRTTEIDGRMELLCTNIKAKNIVIYTVGVGVDSSSKALLQQCATTPDQYYDVNSSGTDMSSVFSTIAASIQNLRITK